jgi:hypothetical protein
MNIDRAARNQLAEAIRALAAGLITNDQFEDKRMPYSNTDPAINEVYSKGAWCLYSDLQEYRLKGRHKLDEQTKKNVARWVVFLKTDLPYEWPVPTPRESLLRFFANLLTLGMANRRHIAELKRQGDAEVWPFIRRCDFEAALKEPKYLHAL